MRLARRLWNLTNSQRLLILLCAGVYLALFRPWTQGHAADAPGVYAGAGAMIVVALLPAKMRLVSVLAIVLLTVVLVLVAFGAIPSQG